MFAAAQDANDDAKAAGEKATTTLKDAVDASGKLGTVSVDGESMMATDNAQTVLDAPDALAKAVMDAQAALDSAKATKVHADNLADDNASKTSLVNALDAAIVVAEENVKTATEAHDSAKLKRAVLLVEGNVEDMPMTAADHGKAVAMDIGGALMPAPTNGGRIATRSIHATTEPAVPAAPAVDVVTRDDDHIGKTWAEIVGADNIKEMRLDTDDANDTDVFESASFAGMPLSSIGTPPEVGKVEDGREFSDASYMGIPGTAFLRGHRL